MATRYYSSREFGTEDSQGQVLALACAIGFWDAYQISLIAWERLASGQTAPPRN